MYYYHLDQAVYAAFSPSLPLEPAQSLDGRPLAGFLVERDPRLCRMSFCVSNPRQLVVPYEDVSWLDPDRMGVPAPTLPPAILHRIENRTLRTLNFRHPRWADGPWPVLPKRSRIHLVAVGDVGGTLLTALKLLGSDCIDRIGIFDLSETTVARWNAEMGQISWPWDYDALPEVEPVSQEQLFDCDVLVFAATRGIPPVGSAVQDVRMAQFAANRPLVETYARGARAAGFQGLFAVMSDPVDPLCKAAYLVSNQDDQGHWDGKGLLPEQVQGFGLGVMNARAAYLAKSDPRFASFLTEGRSFGPHGQGLVIANSIDHYDDALSRALTEEVLQANHRIRALGFKPYVAPAVSSGALQLLLMLRGEWHCGSVCLGGVWFGVRNRFTAAGLETEALSLPDALFARLRETQRLLEAIL